jgi:hypothetical protein
VPEPHALLIEHATLIDGVAPAPHTDASVLVSGDRIVDSGPSARVAAHREAAQARRIDARGRWIIPGLIDSHVHTALVGFEAMPVFLAAGVTTVRDTGGPLDLMEEFRDRLAAGESPGPRLIFCGPLIDGEPLSWPAAVLPIAEPTARADGAARLADECIARGAGSVKLYFRLPRESLRAAIARVAGRVPVTGHLGAVRASEAVADGIDGFEHALITLHNDVVPDAMRFDVDRDSMTDPAFWPGLLRAWAEADLDAPPAQALLDSMRAHDVTLDPTLDLLSDRGREEDDPRLRYVRAELRGGWDMLRAARGAGRPEPQPFVRRGLERVGEYVRRYHALGGRVIVGTDTGAIPYVIPGFGIHAEMQLLAEAGLSAAAVLRAATIEAARALRIEGETGSIEPGKCGDLVLLDADPLADIANVARIHSVVRAGVIQEPARLLAPLDAPK